MLLHRLLSSHLASYTTMFKAVCLGGTFDGIHAGHKLLFGEALKLCSERLLVGVTDGDMIKNKILWELITPVEQRIQSVHKSLCEMKPDLKYQVVPIRDIYGPAVEDKELECIVVSRETVKGADKINEVRRQKNWPLLKVHIVNLIQDEDCLHKDSLTRLGESKISSSLLRVEKLGTIINPPTTNESIPPRPYLIGLTGGVASGKTSIGKYLESIGFGYINYDLLGHQTYSDVGSPTYNKIVEHFGDSIVDAESRQINRSRLGQMVFADKSKLETLNKIVWPAIYDLVDREIERLKSEHEVIILESALLIESGQTKRVHQVWTTIVSPEEAVARQMNTRGLSKVESERRVAAQLDNVSRISCSNVVFSSQWDLEFTRNQVDRCVKVLREKYLANKV